MPAEVIPIRGYDPQSLGAECGDCPLKGHTPVPPSRLVKGRLPKFIIIGEAPGKTEVWKGQPFMGISGRLLDKSLAAADLVRYDAHITNAMACKPDDDRVDVKLAATSCCAPRLAKEIVEVSEKAGEKLPLLPMGAWGLRATLGVNGIQKARGFLWETPHIDPKKIETAKRGLQKLLDANKGKPAASTLVRAAKRRRAIYLLQGRAQFPGHYAIPTVHPAFILRGADGWLPVMREDLKKFGRLLRGELELDDEAPYEVAKTPSEVTKLIGRLRGEISLDIETAGTSVLQDPMLCLALSDGDRTVVIYPWHRKLGPSLRRALAGRVVVFHNGFQFDHIVLAREGVLD